MQQHSDSNLAISPLQLFWLTALAITGLRVLILLVSPAELGPDEAQYWYWSRDLAFGYFSKPPVIAWSIGTTTVIFGNAEWAVRLSAPFFHLGAASFLYLMGRRVFSERTAFWAGIGWLLIPGVILSSFVIATDAPLLFFWSGALFFFFRILGSSKAAPMDFAALGAMVGFGLLSKYAMIYFPLTLIMLMALKPVRAKFSTPWVLVAALFALALFAPNIIWNLRHDFQTISHTAANANWDATLFRPLSLLGFIGEQFLVFGVITFTALLIGMRSAVANRATLSQEKLILLAFTITPLVVVAFQAFISRAHANWAAAAYPSAMLFATAFLLERKAGWLVKTNAAVHVLGMLAFAIGITNFALVDTLGFSGALKHIRGWENQTAIIAAKGDGYDAILIDDRYLISEMLYYQRHIKTPIAAIDPNAGIDHHFEAFLAFDPQTHKRVLFASIRDDSVHVDYRFNSVEPVGVAAADLGDAGPRSFALFALDGYSPPGSK
ncbi:glycosyltransferase family 39 protein [Hyphococcus flavus]|uniref:Glycosyltransferase family 39 protein n=1 Tax=Hyphococcus flavus TaxID=1866326 RepID=A0AAE9ZCT6_9PROT|nr:glycosyltransferase family 39 protein [Hyphococcus flavus]WDI32573.1 glycosyltransferase family 39 protein [Hyphococcus flavus]